MNVYNRINVYVLKFTINTLEKVMKYVQSELQNYQSDANDIVFVYLLLPLNMFHTFSSVSVVDFEQVNIS